MPLDRSLEHGAAAVAAASPGAPHSKRKAFIRPCADDRYIDNCSEARQVPVSSYKYTSVAKRHQVRHAAFKPRARKISRQSLNGPPDELAENHRHSTSLAIREA